MPKQWLTHSIGFYYYRIYYFDVCIVERDIIIWWLDGGHYPVPLPKIKDDHTSNLEYLEAEPEKPKYTWELSRYSLEYKVAERIAKIEGIDLDNLLGRTKIEIIE